MAWRRLGRWKVELISFAVWSLCSASVAAEPSAAPGQIERYQLANGLRVVLAPDRVTPGVSVVVRYDVGTADAPPGHRGLAHLVEHLTFRGSTHVAPLESTSLLQDLGAGFNATTGLEDTTYYTQLPARGLETALWLESERMGFTLGRLDQDALDVERRIVQNEYREGQRSLGRLLERHWLRALYGDQHPFVPDLEQADDVSGVTLAGAQWFFQTAYRPDNATLAIVGKLDVAQTRALVQKYFGSLVAARLPRASLRPAAPKLCGVHRLGLSHSGLFGHYLRFTWPLPLTASPAERASEELLEQVLERRMNGALVAGGADVAGANVHIERFRTHALLTVELELHEEGDARASEQAVMREVKALSSGGPDAAELRTSRANLISISIFRRENGLGRATALADGRDPDSEAVALRGLTARDVQRAAQPLAGPGLVMHAWASKADDGQDRVEQDENPCR